MSSLRRRIRKDCLGLLDSLSAMKRPFKNENELLHHLALLNRSYLSLISKVEYRPLLVNLESEKEERGLRKLYCKETGFSVVVSKDYGLLSVSTGNDEINSSILRSVRASQKPQSLDALLSLYADYRHRRCDVCLRVRDFSLRYTSVRIVDGDYVAAYHAECFEK